MNRRQTKGRKKSKSNTERGGLREKSHRDSRVTERESEGGYFRHTGFLEVSSPFIFFLLWQGSDAHR